jgi:hypothetical protein
MKQYCDRLEYFKKYYELHKQTIIETSKNRNNIIRKKPIENLGLVIQKKPIIINFMN